MAEAPAGPARLFGDVVGQDEAVATLRASASSPVHAYLIVGPAGTGKRATARSFAACLVCPRGGCGECRHCRMAMAGAHPDVVTVERTGAFIGVEEAREVAHLAAHTPLEAARRVMVLADFHLVDRAAPALLKTIEEPPPSTVFIVLADRMVPELVTIASRCVTVQLRPLSAARLAETLVAEGVEPGLAGLAAASAGGRLDRARLLTGDPDLARREEAWRAVPARLDGTGATVARLAGELLAACESVLEPLRERQAAELDRLAAAAAARGEKGVAARREVEERHRREQRRARTDELRAGLATLARAYAGGAAGPAAASRAVAAVHEAGRALDRNPNETLLLQDLLLRLSVPTGR